MASLKYARYIKGARFGNNGFASQATRQRDFY